MLSTEDANDDKEVTDGRSEELSCLSSGENAMEKKPNAETLNNTGNCRKRERGSSECSHKVIEKRRRDRINRCLTELGKIIPLPEKNGIKQVKRSCDYILYGCYTDLSVHLGPNYTQYHF